MGGQSATGGQSGAGGLQQLIVSIDFIGGRAATSGIVDAPAMTATETAGVKLAANWNGAGNAAGTLANLRAADGTLTTAAVTWNAPANAGNTGVWTNGFADAAGNIRMINGYLDPTSSALPATVKVTGLPAAIAGGYDVYVYAYGDIPDTATRTYQYALGSSFTVSQTGPSATVPGFTRAPPGGAGNYILYRNVSGASFTLTATPGTGPQSRAPINGIQIVWPSGS